MFSHHNTLGELIADTAQKLLSVATDGVDDLSKEVLADIGRFFALDAVFLWHNTHNLGATELIAQWPARKCVSDSDPAFALADDLDKPAALRLNAQSKEFRARITPGTSAPDILSIAVAPLIPPGGDAVGNLELVRYGYHDWPANDLDALTLLAAVFANVKLRTDREREMKRLSEQDSLTGLWNRRKLIQLLEFRLSHGASDPVAILYVSPDRLRTVNAVLGHAAGDQLMTHLSNQVQAQMGDSGFIARPGDDEIAVVLDGPASHQHAEAFAQHLRDKFRGRIILEAERVQSSMSIAVAVGFPGRHSASDLMSHVSRALSSIRAAGGNDIATFRDDLAETFNAWTDIELNLQRAIEEEELVLFFQPEVDLRTGAIVALESRVQWNHPSRGHLPLEQFMPVAEATNQAAMLGRRILWICCEQLHHWRSNHLAQSIVMRIKLSPAQVLTEDFPAYLTKTLDYFQLPAHAISLEFPESDLFYEPSASATLRNLKATGVGLTLADFGTGYGSLAGLKSLPFDTLKIDGSFVQSLPNDDGNAAIFALIATLSQEFELDLVASGLQHYADAKALVGLGCGQAQGPLVSPPSTSRLRQPSSCSRSFRTSSWAAAKSRQPRSVKVVPPGHALWRSRPARRFELRPARPDRAAWPSSQQRLQPAPALAGRQAGDSS
ncbi:putative bifunctional diguanylate cyclase/phosphodiesterase [Mycolicibacterium aubagnense]|uniref:Bifunctional diguanylate cyclase/phosphodiesterase n=1 Tax=Mycolicibacterium aubagnense TaxID=319707 RepID=A0ABM7IMK4_9MYCO|nr:phosphodiesterase [Mycolicibacterium aubagnense]TLH48586.1 hypothetical protein C1S80_29865 [Mycolicibacterium aubagnense]BBX87999.1 bifunctional diguanylate cyclase/phosphodiesterase [Mycolicibacterium aubagnense]